MYHNIVTESRKVFNDYEGKSTKFRAKGKTLVEVKSTYVSTGGNHIDVPEGCEGLGDTIFALCPITSITLPSTLKTIGKNAFMGSDIQHICLPEGLESVGEGAFTSSKLSSVVFPRSLKKVGHGAFSDTKLTEVIMPMFVPDIHFRAFFQCPIDRITIQGTHYLPMQSDGALYLVNGKKVFNLNLSVAKTHLAGYLTTILEMPVEDLLSYRTINLNQTGTDLCKRLINARLKGLV